MQPVGPSLNCPFWQDSHVLCPTKRYNDELETLLTIQQAITSRLDLSDVLQLIAEEAQRLTSAQLGILYVLEGDELCIAAISGYGSSDELIGYRVPVAQSVAGLSIKTSQSIMIADVYSDPRVYREAIDRFGMGCYMAVPLISGARPIGVIAVANQETRTLGPDNLRVLGMLAPSAVIGLENARLYHEQQMRRLEAEGRHQMAEGLRVMLAILNSNRSLDEILDYIVTQVSSRLLDCQAMAIFRWQAEDESLTIQAAHGLPADLAAAAHFLPRHGAVGQAVLMGRPLAITNAAAILSGEVGLELTPAEQALVTDLAGHYQAWLAVPLVVKDNTYGAILLFYRQARTFSEEEIGLALVFTDQVALAIENAWLRVQAEQAAVMAERNRLARELHDSVSQTLFSANLIAEVLPRLWDRHEAEGRHRLNELGQLTRGALAEMRTLLFELRPLALQKARLGELLKHLTEAVFGRARIPITLTVEGGDRTLPAEVQLALYRISQEALNNVAKHAGSSQAEVSLRYYPEQVELIISDDGCGFDPSCVSPEHLGLGIMYERAAAIQAMMKLTSSPGHGTRIEVVWADPAAKGANND